MEWKTIFSAAVLSAFVLASCGKGSPVSLTETGSTVQQVPFVFPKEGKIADQRFGKEVWFAYGSIAGSPQLPANGFAKSHCFEAGKCLHTLQVNIPVEKEGTFYEGWLENPADGKKISTGHLTSAVGDARHGLSFTTSADLRQFTAVSITLEADDGNPEPAPAPVAQGSLKELKRDN